MDSMVDIKSIHTILEKQGQYLTLVMKYVAYQAALLLIPLHNALQGM
jgi:hypothetical protein